MAGALPPIRPENCEAAVQNAINHSIVCGAALLSGFALRIITEAKFVTAGGAALQAGGGYGLALIASDLTGYLFEKLVPDNVCDDNWKRKLLIIVRYALPMLAAGATAFGLSVFFPFNTILFISVSVGLSGFSTLMNRTPLGRDPTRVYSFIDSV